MSGITQAEENVDVALAVVDDALEVHPFCPQVLYEGMADRRECNVVIKVIGKISLFCVSLHR